MRQHIIDKTRLPSPLQDCSLYVLFWWKRKIRFNLKCWDIWFEDQSSLAGIAENITHLTDWLTDAVAFKKHELWHYSSISAIYFRRWNHLVIGTHQKIKCLLSPQCTIISFSPQYHYHCVQCTVHQISSLLFLLSCREQSTVLYHYQQPTKWKQWCGNMLSAATVAQYVDILNMSISSI